MITEFIEGGTIKDSDLSDWTTRERMECFGQVCRAIASVHGKGYLKSDIYHGNVFLKEDKTPVIGDFEHTGPIKNTDCIAGEMTSLAQLFWELMEEEDFTNKMVEERRLNEQIESLTSQLDELKQQKAQLLS